jgi:hypothetical protein
MIWWTALIREAVDSHIAELDRSRNRLRAWEETKAFIQQLMKRPVPEGAQVGRTWKREDLYDRPYPGRY